MNIHEQSSKLADITIADFKDMMADILDKERDKTIDETMKVIREVTEWYERDISYFSFWGTVKRLISKRLGFNKPKLDQPIDFRL